jgi:hypothetical protein
LEQKKEKNGAKKEWQSHDFKNKKGEIAFLSQDKEQRFTKSQ